MRKAALTGYGVAVGMAVSSILANINYATSVQGIIQGNQGRKADTVNGVMVASAACMAAKQRVRDAKASMNGVGANACQVGDRQYTLRIKLQNWLKVAAARDQRDSLCPPVIPGPNGKPSPWGEAEENMKAWLHVGKCAGLMAVTPF